MNWENGHQNGCTYKKLKIWSFKIGRFGSDCYLLKYEPKSILQSHVDEVDGKHYRMNITLKGKSSFGILRKKRWRRTKNRIVIFRPDLDIHNLVVYDKPTLKLSLGIAILNKQKNYEK